MRLQSLPPVGNAIRLERSFEPLEQLLPGYRLVWVHSGTAALAYSLAQLKRRFPQVARPEVIIPGYCCPDLLSAAVYAGFTAKIVDICAADPSYDLTQLQGALTAKTLAVIAVNFLGIAERLTEIRQLIRPWPKIALIEDNAQWFPDQQEVAQLEGDYVTFSFGRGKAVNLLGGGLVAIKDPIALFDLGLAHEAQSTLWLLKARLISLLTQPWVYYWLEKLTVLKLGITVYHPLTQISLMSPAKVQLVKANVSHYRAMNRTAQKQLLERIPANQNRLHQLLLSSRCRRLLRFPLLFDDVATRSALLEEVEGKGMGVSCFYNTELLAVEGVEALGIALAALPNARSFAHRLVTFPTHPRVKPKHLAAITALFKTVQLSE
ncbi:DegT/DnrJ/EryC1/StrS family aminotransferase [Reinekea sp.]|jgi:dTDP-4-amino-4,6-dideoxygalactose transaminase|uniref:DegT/DnrJ/EryC1/StrS family aminotransferase n=1 Tax=Reinekea sp. TaxID=1970455 RepID=UPI002A7ED098|nr:DegT/DnrJ/EryC1/StrS family aminotransferase [Reinekea sp.]